MRESTGEESNPCTNFELDLPLADELFLKPVGIASWNFDENAEGMCMMSSLGDESYFKKSRKKRKMPKMPDRTFQKDITRNVLNPDCRRSGCASALMRSNPKHSYPRGATRRCTHHRGQG